MKIRAVGVIVGLVTAVTIFIVLVFAGAEEFVFMPYMAVHDVTLSSSTPTATTNSPTATASPTPTVTGTASPIISPTVTPTPPNATPSVTYTHTPTIFPTPSATVTLTPPPSTPSATHTHTPTTSPTPSPTSTISPTISPSPTVTVTPCPTQFEAPPIAGNTFVEVTGEVGNIVRITDLTVGIILGSDTLLPEPGHICPGFADFSPPNQLNPPLILGHVLLAENLNDGTFDMALVTAPPTPGTGTPTVTLTYTVTPTPTPAPATPTVTPTWTPTPSPTPTTSPTYTPTPTASSSATPSPTPTPNILFVVGNVILSPEDASIRSQLAALNPAFPGDLSKIQVMDDAVAQTSQASGKDLVVISDSVAANNVNTKFRDVAVPVMLWENNLYDDMGMTSGANGSGTVLNQIEIAIVNDTHPLAGGLSVGVHQVYASAADLTWGFPGVNAEQIATLTTDGTKYVIFAYDVGAAMPGLRIMPQPDGLGLCSGI